VKKINSCICIEAYEKLNLRKIEESEKIVISPEMCMFVNDDDSGFIFEFILPGVKKDTIKLLMNDKQIFIKGESELFIYTNFYRLSGPVLHDKVKATYDKGLLRVEIPFKDLTTDMMDIEIN